MTPNIPMNCRQVILATVRTQYASALKSLLSDWRSGSARTYHDGRRSRAHGSGRID